MSATQLLLYILRICEAIACITGFLYWKKLKGSFWTFFPLYLLLIVIVEFIGNYLTIHHMTDTKKIFFNYFDIPFEFLFFFWVYYKSSHKGRERLLPVISVLVYLISWVVDTLYLSTRALWFYSFSYTVGNLLLLVLILRFFIQLVTTEAILVFKQKPLFWVSTGLLIFYLGTLPYYGLRNTLVGNKNLYIPYSYIVNVLNCLMYLMFTLSFIWSKPNIKYSSS